MQLNVGVEVIFLGDTVKVLVRYQYFGVMEEPIFYSLNGREKKSKSMFRVRETTSI